MIESRITAFVVGTALFATSLAAPGCNRAQPETKAQPIPKVTVTPVIAQEIYDSDEYTGRTEASEAVEVRARVFGYLNTVEFSDGDFVKEDKRSLRSSLTSTKRSMSSPFPASNCTKPSSRWRNRSLPGMKYW